MKRNILLFFIFSIFVCLFPTKIYAVSTNKNEFPYEISNVSFENNYIVINGWGMVVNKHHYDSKDTHYYELSLISDSETLTYISKPKKNSQTNTMRYLGVDKCKVDDYYERGTSCYYNYDYVGFEFKIPIKDLNINESYESKLTIHSNVLNFSSDTYVFYPILTPLTKMKGKIKYEISSNLYDTTLTIADFGVFDRITPNKSSKVRQTDSMCNSSFGYNRYFDKYSKYTKVYDRKVNESTIFYKVKTGSSTVCKLGRNVVSEGKTYESWIAGNWVDFSGEPMTIKVTDTNTPPEITIIKHPTITIDETNQFDFKKYIISKDKEDGIITNRTIVLNKVKLNRLGEFKLNLEVEDSDGEKAHETLIVNVIEGNTPPTIYAKNITIYQYESFDYLEDVYALDSEDGDVTKNITYEGKVNTNILGKYKIKYYVYDSKNKITSKTIYVNVIRNPLEKIRYISTKEDLLFYKRNIPINWKKKIDYLIEQLENPKVFITNKFKLNE